MPREVHRQTHVRHAPQGSARRQVHAASARYVRHAPRQSRARERERLLAAAASVHVPLYSDVIVVGGGAAGLVAAITAAEAGASVVVLEGDLECGRSILATGNGRCNFSNARLSSERFNEPAFVSSVCGNNWAADVLGFFRASGLRWSLEDDRLYPMSRQAASVRNVLLVRARAAGVVLAPAREVVDVSFIHETIPDPSWIHDADNRSHYNPLTSSHMPRGLAEVAHAEAFDKDGLLYMPGARAVILATGGEAFPSLVDLGVVVEPRRGVLCPLACEPSPLSKLDGRRAQVCASLTKAADIAGDRAPAWSERGEVLWRSYGLSGIVTFNLSRRAEAGDLVELDLAPDLPRVELQGLVDPEGDGTFAPGALDGVIDPVVAALLERLARERWYPSWLAHDRGEGASRSAATQDAGRPAAADGVRGEGQSATATGSPGPFTSDAVALVSLVKALPFRVVGSAEEDRAQVMRGGIATGQLAVETLALRRHPWLYACGEAIDVDGDCGGFNLAWAWKSGMVAGAAAARWALS